jgi:hypothetical protein
VEFMHASRPCEFEKVASLLLDELPLLMPGPSSSPLKPCLSKARHASLAQRRLPNVRPLIGDGLGPTRKDAHQTFRVRKDRSLKELPLPPLLDPVILEHRSRFEAPKKTQTLAEKTPFQKRLWQNPYGRHSWLSNQANTDTV